MRLIPVQSVCGPTPEKTSLLRLLMLLGEVERQAEIYSDALEDAITAALEHNDTMATWRHLQGAIFAAIIVNRLVTDDGPTPKAWPWLNKASGRQAALSARAWRVAELRRLLQLPDEEGATPIYTMRHVRNDLEHIAERLGAALHFPGYPSLSDWYLSDGIFLTSGDDPQRPQMAGLRGFYPEHGLLMFDRSPLNMFTLDLDMHKLRHNAREAQAELAAIDKGPPQYGGTVVEEWKSSREVVAWRRQREELRAELPPPVNIGRARLWVEVESAED